MAHTQSGNLALKNQTGISTPNNPEAGIQAMLKAEVPRIQRLFQDPRMTTRFVQLAMVDMRRVPKLFECHPHSVLGCMMQAAALGLYFGMNGQCYMVPYGKEATFVTGWRGHVTLALRGAMGSMVNSGAVRPGDEFDYSDGSKPFVHHKRLGDRDAEPTYFWSTALQPGARYPVIDVMTAEYVRKHRDRYNKVGARHYSFGGPENWEGYGRKVPTLQTIKYLPLTYESAVAAELDYAADKGIQKLRPEDVEAGVVASEPERKELEQPSEDGQYFSYNPDAEPVE
jgi:recombination protein RecT